MALDLRADCRFRGPALPEPFVQLELERELTKKELLPRTTGADGVALQTSWESYRRRLRELAVRAGATRVRHHVIDSLVERLGYAQISGSDEIHTREGAEDGGDLLTTQDGTAHLRVWCVELNEDLEAPARRGAAYRYSHLRVAQRVLNATGERVGLLTNGTELRVLLSDPARTDSEIEIELDPAWKRSRDVPDSFRLLLALASPAGVRAVADLIDKARLAQTRVTRDLRKQAQQAIERFVQEVLDHPDNRAALAALPDRAALARDLWHEGLAIVYRLLFVLKLEASDDPARVFAFASSSLWRQTFSPSTALSRFVRPALEGHQTGRMLEDGLRTLFRMFSEGVQSSGLTVAPLGGALFGAGSAPRLAQLRWGERGVAHLLDRLLWTEAKSGGREHVHYGPLDVEDLGRVYEALLEREPGIATEPMCRLRRQKLEVVVPLAQGERYHAVKSTTDDAEEGESDDAVDEADDGAPASRKTRVEWIEEIAPGQFYLRVGLGRKATGSYYTPHSFVRFLVRETLGPKVAQRSPEAEPNPAAILALKVLDPAMGSGHFIVEACRFLGRHLYEACRLCDERALTAERRAEAAGNAADRDRALSEATEWRQRLAALPDPDQELVKYLPSRAPERQESGFSQRKAEALCRRLVAVHCLYGVDKNPLAVELAKLALWIEAHAEGLPLTFLDHRLVVGDSLTGPFFEHLLRYPGTQEPMDDLFTDGLQQSFTAALSEALKHVAELEASTGITVADIEAKRAAKARLDRALAPFRVVAAAWAGGVMLGPEVCDDEAYARLVKHVAEQRSVPAEFSGSERLRQMVTRGLGVTSPGTGLGGITEAGETNSGVPAFPYDLAFAEVFFPFAALSPRRGFDAVLGNPPWDAVRPKAREFFATYDVSVLEVPTKRERVAIENRLLASSVIAAEHERYEASFAEDHRIHGALYRYQVVEVDGDRTGGDPDLAKVFMERNAQIVGRDGTTGTVVPSAFHANEGATGIRRLYLNEMAMRACFSFENRRQLFEIHRSFKFALVVADRRGPTIEFACAFYLHDDEWLFAERRDRESLTYTLDFVRRTGGEYLSLLELRSQYDLEVSEVCFRSGEPFGDVCERHGIRIGRELHMTDDAFRFTPSGRAMSQGEDTRDPTTACHLLVAGYLVLHEGKTFRQYDDRWDESPRYVVAVHDLSDRPQFLRATRHFRLAHRKIAGPGDENISIWALHPPGVIHGDSAPTEIDVVRPTSVAVQLLAIMNSVTFDYLLSLRVRANVLGFMRDAQPIPRVAPWAFLAHSALRLSCNHVGYAPLWREQVGDAWREQTPPETWPVLSTDDRRWAIRAAVDAIVADAYGLNRGQYEHVLSAFSHKSYPQAPRLCLERFDELKAIGVDAFTRKYDPYWDIPLNENLPEPVIDIPLPVTGIREAQSDLFYRPVLDDQSLRKVAEEEAPYQVRQAGDKKPSGGKRRGTPKHGDGERP